MRIWYKDISGEGIASEEVLTWEQASVAEVKRVSRKVGEIVKMV